MQFQQDAQQQLQKSYADMMEPIYKKIEMCIRDRYTAYPLVTNKFIDRMVLMGENPIATDTKMCIRDSYTILYYKLSLFGRSIDIL